MCIWPCCHVTTRCFDAEGNQQWTANHGGNVRGIAVDSSGNVFTVGERVTASSGNQVTTRKYAPNGLQLWERVGNSNAVTFGLQCCAVDVDGALYTAGYPDFGTDSNSIRKYDADGNLIWSAFTSGVAITGIAVDASKNLYAAHTVSVTSYLLKFDPSGTLLWQAPIPCSDGFGIRGAVALDSSGNPHVSTNENSLGGGGRTVAKFDPSGALVWSINTKLRTLTTTPKSIAVDSNGVVYDGGFGIGFNAGKTVQQVTAAPALGWTLTDDPSGTTTGLAVDSAFNLYTTCGQSVRQYDNAQVLQWTGTHGAPLYCADCDDGRVYVAGAVA